MEKLLFIGNSHTYFNDMPHIVTELYRLCGAGEADAVMLTAGGMSLTWHAGQTSERFCLKYGSYDAVILQDVAHPFIGRDEVLKGVGALKNMITCKETKVCLYMTWASLANPEAQQDMINAYTEAQKTYGTLLAPVGRVWERVRYGGGNVPLFWQDGEHASIYGSYLAACTIFCTLTGKKELNPDTDDAFYRESGLDEAYVDIIH
ncbi:MAG: hypothetical protein MJ175_09595, partial [Clostridia bacterium]|nr:hypothetical protein [Clostridia bacterium]